MSSHTKSHFTQPPSPNTSTLRKLQLELELSRRLQLVLSRKLKLCPIKTAKAPVGAFAKASDEAFTKAPTLLESLLSR